MGPLSWVNSARVAHIKMAVNPISVALAETGEEVIEICFG
jgi:hypothetical protein